MLDDLQITQGQLTTKQEITYTFTGVKMVFSEAESKDATPIQTSKKELFELLNKKGVTSKAAEGVVTYN